MTSIKMEWKADKTVCCLAVVMSLLSFTSGHESQSFRIEALGDPVKFNCTERALVNRIDHWMEPSSFFVMKPGKEYKGAKVSRNGREVEISKVENDNLGDYFCVYHDNEGTPVYNRVRVWLYDPTFAEVYRLNLIIAFVASAIFLILAIIGCFLFNRKVGGADKYNLHEMYTNADYAASVSKRENVPSYSATSI